MKEDDAEHEEEALDDETSEPEKEALDDDTSEPEEETSEPKEEAPPPLSEEGASPTPFLIAAVVTLASGAAVFQAFRPDNSGQPSMLIALGAVYALLSAVTLLRFHKTGQLRQRVAPRRGDITIGAMIAVAMYVVGVAVHLLLTSRGSPKEAWLIRVYLQIGDPQVATAFFIGPVILAIAAAEELVWRGLVMGALGERLTPRNAVLLTTLLYTLAHASTMYLLRDPTIGWNPLVVMAAAGCGLVWGYLANAVGRLSLSMVAHALFTWSVVEFPIMNM